MNSSGLRAKPWCALRLFCAALLCATLIGIGPLSAPAALAGEKVTEDGVLHVKNGSEPAQGNEKLELEEIWRAGGDDDEDVLFGLIGQALTDDESNVYLLDSQLSHIEVYSPEGEHLKTLGREGSGPGEFTRAFDMVFMPDGTLGVVQVFPGKIIQLDLEGIPAGVYQPSLSDAVEGGFLVLVNSLASGGNLVLSGIDISFDQETLTQTRNYFVKSFGSNGKPVATYHTDERIWNFQNFTLEEKMNDFVWGRLHVGDDGKVVAAIPSDDYVLTVFNADGSIDRVIERDYDSWKRNDRARARMQAQLEGQLRQFPPGTESKMEENEPDVSSLFVHEDGSIWVVTSRAMWDPKPGVFMTYDVFSPEGDFIKQVDVIAEGSSANDGLIFAKGGMIIQITGFFDALVAAVGGLSADTDEEAQAMEVICYRAKPSR